MNFAFYFWTIGLILIAVSGSLFFMHQDRKESSK
jgi:hypothetical protein